MSFNVISYLMGQESNGGGGVNSAWNDNFIVNWDFSNPVNSKGSTSYTYTSETETIDGWIIRGGTVDLVTDGIRLTRAPNYSIDMYFLQKYRITVNPFFSKTLTLSIIVDGTLQTSTFIMPNTTGIVLDSVIHYGVDNDFAVVYYDSRIYIQFFLRSDSTNHIVNAVKLEVGNTQTLCTQAGGICTLNKTMVKNEEDAKKILFIT